MTKALKKRSKFFFTLLALLFGLGAVGVSFFVLPLVAQPLEYTAPVKADEKDLVIPPAPPVVTHLATPAHVRAIYMSSWVAGTPGVRAKLVKIAAETEVNAIVIDVKDYTGKIAFEVTNPQLLSVGSAEPRIKDIKEFIADLHAKNIYAIARIASFQDQYLPIHRPDLAVKQASSGAIWGDYKKSHWLDSAAPEAWEYLVAVAREAYSVGFDELNFDYIRFPSDGNMRDIAYPFFTKTGKTKAESMKDFFAYLRHELDDLGAPLSADFFGMVTTNTDDLGIGQVLESGVTYFDYIAPMVYPSHYPPTFMGFKNPATMPYEVVKHSLDEAVRRVKVLGFEPAKIRPWFQDFNLGATYDAAMIRKEKQAAYDAGLQSWMMWSPSNQYTVSALDPEQ